MKSRYLLFLVLMWLIPEEAEARIFGHRSLAELQRCLRGQLVDFTDNHGVDRRIWSAALCSKRDLYVYLPPGYDAGKKYPLLLWFHGIDEDEKGLPEQALADIDRAIACGKLPPLIVAIPDGSLAGRPGRFSPHSGFLNSKAGPFEDYLLRDVYSFLQTHFPIRREREAHVLAGVSIGGGAAFHHGIKQRQEFGVVIGVFPPLNLLWLDCRGRYFGNFDPDCWGRRTNYRLGLEPVGKFAFGLVRVPWCRLVRPLYGHGPQVVEAMSRDNPIELMETQGLQDGELAMLVAYGSKDQFNIDAQVESFLYRARELGIRVDCLRSPRGRHDAATARSFLPHIFDWLAPRLAPFAP